jgi:hypothetical protein
MTLSKFTLELWKFISKLYLLNWLHSKILEYQKNIHPEKSKHFSNLYSETKRFKESKHFYIPKMLSKSNDYLGT